MKRRDFMKSAAFVGATAKIEVLSGYENAAVPVPAKAAVAATSSGKYYVSPDGVDDGTDPDRGKSMEKAWRTIQFASTKVGPGDDVLIKPGSYSPCKITDCQGTAEKPITFRKAPGQGQVVVDGTIFIPNEWTSHGGAIYSTPIPFNIQEGDIGSVFAGEQSMLGPNYGLFVAAKPANATALRSGQCFIENGRLYVRLFDDSAPVVGRVRATGKRCITLARCRYTVWEGVAAKWSTDAGYKIEEGSSYNSIRDAEIGYVGQGILEVTDNPPFVQCSFNTFERLDIHHIGLTFYEHGIYTSGTRTRILNCRFRQISGAGIHAYPNAVQGEYDGNRVEDPRFFYHLEYFTVPPAEREQFRDYYIGLQILGEGGHRITNNLIVGPFSQGINLNGSRANWILNNTIVLSKPGASAIALPHISGENENRIQNNIIQTTGYYIVDQAPAYLDHNGYYGSQKGWRFAGIEYRTLSDVTAAYGSKELHGLEQDPQFLADYSLSSSSPMLSKGSTYGAPAIDIKGNPRPTPGGQIDLGAYEKL